MTALENSLLVKQWPLDRVKPYPGNPRIVPDSAILKVAASIAEFGWRQPIVVDSRGVILAGHTRLLAARHLELETVPVHVAKGLSAAKRKAYRLADNRTAEEACWIDKLLALEVGNLQELGFDLSLTGFDPPELADLLKGKRGGSDPDAARDLPDHPVSRLGDTWLCGPHRVLCGDACAPGAVGALLDGATPVLMVTDPPYGVEYDPDWRTRVALRAAGGADGVVEADDRVDWREAFALFPGQVAYCWHAGRHASEVQASLEAEGFKIRGQVIWAKQHFAISRGHYHWQHEPCWYAVRKKAHWRGGREQSSVWQVANRGAFGGVEDDASTKHSTQKPVEVMRRPIENHTLEGGSVYDPFLGSGTTMIAADQIGRVCLGIDIDPAYVDVAVQRAHRQGREAQDWSRRLPGEARQGAGDREPCCGGLRVPIRAAMSALSLISSASPPGADLPSGPLDFRS